jgi:hypothetical protein
MTQKRISEFKKTWHEKIAVNAARLTGAVREDVAMEGGYSMEGYGGGVATQKTVAATHHDPMPELDPMPRFGDDPSWSKEQKEMEKKRVQKVQKAHMDRQWNAGGYKKEWGSRAKSLETSTGLMFKP